MCNTRRYAGHSPWAGLPTCAFGREGLNRPHPASAMRCTELNPVRAGLAARFWDWPWSSARACTMEDAIEVASEHRWPERLAGWNHAGAGKGACSAVGQTANRTRSALGARTSAKGAAMSSRRLGRSNRLVRPPTGRHGPARRRLDPKWPEHRRAHSPEPAGRHP
jgi:hypothetical protein